MHTLAISQSPRFSFKVLLGVDDHFISACLARKLGLRVCTGGGDYPRAKVLRQLDQEQAHTAGGRVNQNGIAPLDGIAASGSGSAPSCLAASQPPPDRNQVRRNSSPTCAAWN
jgi:hypothetical protein